MIGSNNLDVAFRLVEKPEVWVAPLWSTKSNDREKTSLVQFSVQGQMELTMVAPIAMLKKMANEMLYQAQKLEDNWDEVDD